MATVAPGGRVHRRHSSQQLDALKRALVLLGVLACGANVALGAGVTTSLIAASVLLPVWWTCAWHERLFRVAAVGFLICAIGGLVLSASMAGGNLQDWRGGLSYTVFVAGSVLAIGLLTKGIAETSIGVVAFWFAVGMLARTVLEVVATGGAFDWKGGLAQPLTMIALVLLAGRPRWLQACGVLGLALVGFEGDARSYGAICIFVAGVILISGQLRRLPRSTAGRLGTLVGALLAALATFAVSVQLALSGSLGEAAQTRTAIQNQAVGGILVSGRPEWIATLGLMKTNPWGYGMASVPSSMDYMAASSALREINIDTRTATYFQEYMFAGEFRIHSIVADAWAHFGLAGLVFTGSLLIFILWRGTLLPQVSAFVGIGTYSAAMAVWFLMFGTVYSNLSFVAFAATVVWAVTYPVYRGGAVEGASRARMGEGSYLVSGS